MATGYLGWTAEQALHTPIPQIMLAIEGKFDFAVKTNPFGQPKDKEKEKERKERLSVQRTALSMARLEAQQKHGRIKPRSMK